MTTPEPSEIRSTANPTVKHLLRLRDNRARRRSGRVIVDGWRETGKAIAAGLELCGVYVTSDWEQSAPDQAVISVAQQQQVLRLVSAVVMEKISFGQSARGVVAEFVQPERNLQRLQLPKTPLILVLDQIEKPGNIGAVFRCADAAGVDAVIMADSQSDLFNPNAIRSSLGTVFTVSSAVASVTEAQAFLLANEIRPLAARVESSQSLWSADLTGPLAIILGSESRGLGNHWQSIQGNPVDGVCIPMAGQIDSLNVSVSAAVLAFEAIRVRNGALDA